MLKKLRRRLDKVRAQKFQCFSDFEPIINKIHADYADLFPKFSEKPRGSHYVYNFGISDLSPITIVKEHGGKHHMPPKFAKRVLEGIDDVLTFIEATVKEEIKSDADGENANETTISPDEAAGTLPETEIPDGDSGG
jgi:hypothetical protein